MGHGEEGARHPRKLFGRRRFVVHAVLLLSLTALPTLAPMLREGSRSTPTADTGLARVGARGGGEPSASPEEPADGLVEGVAERVENVNVDLTLETAKVELVNLNDTAEEFVVYRFGRVVHEVKQAWRFGLLGFDVDTRVSGTGARLVHGDPAAVLVAFPAGTDVAGYTMASVAIGAVEDEAGETNLPGAVALAGSTAGGEHSVTAGPDLVSVRSIGSLDRVVYRYDEELDRSASVDASRFGYYTLDGKRVTGSSVAAVVDRSVTVSFDAQVEEAVRFFASEGAVKSRKGQRSSSTATACSVASGSKPRQW